jgi:predicted nucleotidyltransferase
LYHLVTVLKAVKYNMKTAHEALLSRSTPVVEALATLAEVKAILCFGSYALGTFDQHSDIDLYTFCHLEITPSAARRGVLQKLDGIQELQMDHVELGWEAQWCPRGDRFWLNGVQFDITYNTLNWIQTVVQKVKVLGAASIPELEFRPYTMLGLLENSVILYDPESVLQEIVGNLQPYPNQLRQTLLSQNLVMMRASLEELQNYVLRNIGNTAFHFHLNRVIDELGAVLFALNKRYDPATKRVEAVYRELDILPANFLDRYNQILATPLTPTGRQQMVAELDLLVREIEDLVKQQDKAQVL